MKREKSERVTVALPVSVVMRAKHLVKMFPHLYSIRQLVLRSFVKRVRLLERKHNTMYLGTRRIKLKVGRPRKVAR
jgi:hypothetical protein